MSEDAENAIVVDSSAIGMPIGNVTLPTNPVVSTEDTKSSIFNSESISPPFKPGWRFHVAFIALATMAIVSAIDTTSLPIALPVISAKIHGTAIQAWWSGTGFLLTATVFQPTFASFSHIFGRKPITYTALIFFVIGSVVGGVSKNFTTMIVGRGIQGVGAGGIITMIEILVTDMVPLRERGKWFGYVSH
jgi:MFS family permease